MLQRTQTISYFQDLAHGLIVLVVFSMTIVPCHTFLMYVVPVHFQVVCVYVSYIAMLEIPSTNMVACSSSFWTTTIHHLLIFVIIMAVVDPIRILFPVLSQYTTIIAHVILRTIYHLVEHLFNIWVHYLFSVWFGRLNKHIWVLRILLLYATISGDINSHTKLEPFIVHIWKRRKMCFLSDNWESHCYFL